MITFPHGPARRSLAIAMTCTALFAGTTAFGQNASSQKKSYKFDAEISAGVEYSSNIAIDEIDTFLNSADLAALLGAKLRFKTSLTEELDLNLNYSLSQTTQDDLDQFDLRTHFLSADASYDIGPADIGISQRFTTSSLAGDDFLTYRQTAPYATALLGKKVFARAEIGIAKKDFETINDRDADVLTVSTDWFFFLNGTKTYVLLRYVYSDEDAFAPQFDYESNSITLQFARKFDLLGNGSKLRLGWRLQDREYASDTPSIGVPRDEQRQRLRAILDTSFNERLATKFTLEVGDVDSNLPSANRSSFVGSAELIVRF